MASKKLRESQVGSTKASVASDANDWMMKVVAEFERSFLVESSGLQENARIADLHKATVWAMVHTLIDSGMSSETLVERVGQAITELDPVDVKWSSKLNNRRLNLIDKLIQESITQAEKLELARLAAAMRQHVDSEQNLPMQGGRALHKRLLKAELKDQTH